MDSLLDDMTGEGRLESQGQFTVDAGKIRERYESFQTGTPRYYLARLLQGLVELEPTRISVEVRRQELVLRAESPAVPLALDEISAFFQGTTAFSQGLLTSFLAGCLELDVRSDRLQLRLRPDEEPTLSSISTQKTVEVHLTFARPKGFLGLLTGRAKENAAIHTFLTYSFMACAVPFILDGRPINGTPIANRSPSPHLLVEHQLCDATLPISQAVWGDARMTRPSCFYRASDGRTRGDVDRKQVGNRQPPHFHSALFVRLSNEMKVQEVDRASPCAMILALRKDMPNHSLLYMVDKGLILEAIDLEFGCPGLVAVVPAASLAKDASGLRVVRDQAFDRLLEELRVLATFAFDEFESLKSWEKSASGSYLASEEIGRAQLAYGA